MRGLRSTLLLLGVLLGLGAYIYFVELKRPTVEARPKALEITPHTIERIVVKSSEGDTTTLTKAGEDWRIVSPVTAETDETAVSGITRGVNRLEIRHVVDEKPSDLKQYGLDPPRAEVVVEASGDATPKHLLIGDKTPAGENLYAKLASDSKVFLIAGSFDDTFDKSTWELRDKALLKIDRLQVDSLEVVGPAQKVQLTKRDLEWHLTQPLQSEADLGVVSELITKLTTAQMRSIASPDATQPSRFGHDPPTYTVTVGAGSSRATLHVGAKADESTTYARDLSRPLVFTIENSLADDLNKTVGDYRRKDVFDFEPYEARRVEITRQGSTRTYEKVTATGQDARERWREVSPNVRDLDSAKMATALSRLSLLRAVSFIDPRKIRTGLESPAITVLVRYGEDQNQKQEQVRLTRVESGPFAARDSWPDAAMLDGNAYALVVEALGDLEK
jgi:hypothetical protein